LVFDQNVKDVDGQENVLAGIQNNSGYYIGLTGYNCPNNAFSSLHLTGGHESGEHTSFVIKDFFEHYDGTDDSDDDDYGKLRVTPERSSVALLGTGLLDLGGILRRGLRS
jgi:hypothetical protein